MGQRATLLKGRLYGKPFMASVDCQNHRVDKSDAVQVVTKEEIAERGYQAYILELEEIPEEMKWIKSKAQSYVLGVEQSKSLIDYDVVEVNEYGLVKVRYRADSSDNVIFITNNCNSNCIMCPDNEGIRRKECFIDFDYLKQFIYLIPDDTSHLTITGGEPTLLKYDLIRLIACCRDRFEETSFLMLTNGRTLCNQEYAKQLIAVKPEYFRVGIPIYSHQAELHDAITQAKGSFRQTKKGILHIMNHIEVEIRIVIMKQNYEQLPQIAKMLVQELGHIKTVSFMGIELLGNAAINRDKVWIDYTDSATYIEEAAYILLRAGIEPRIYNYPLCTLPERLWSIAVRSITDYKVRYKEECEMCCAKKKCGGFFFSTIHYDAIKINPIVRNK